MKHHRHAIVIAGIVLGVLCAPHSIALADDKKPTIVVSFGDSYSSGEGCPPFYGQGSADKYADEDWLAHRSAYAWSGQLVVNGKTLSSVKASNVPEKAAPSGDTRWYFYAASGAVTNNVTGWNDPSNDDPRLEKSGRKSLAGESFSVWLDLQLDHALKDIVDRDKLDPSMVKYVTMTVGGNDVGFVDIVTSAVLHNGLVDRDYAKTKLNKIWHDYDGRVRYPEAPHPSPSSTGGTFIRDNIFVCYKKILKAFPNAQLIVAGYPTLLSEEDHDVDPTIGFSYGEASVINSDVREFNKALSAVCDSVNTTSRLPSGQLPFALLGQDTSDDRIHFVSVEKNFEGHEAYTDTPYINAIQPIQSEDINRGITGSISAYSMHPNLMPFERIKGEVHDGISAYRAAVQDKIDELEGTTDEGGPIPDESKDRDSSNVTDEKEAAGERDIALVLDVSGSMGGGPIDETKSAAARFVEIAGKNDASTSLITYDDDASTISGLTTNTTKLKASIDGLNANGGTNIDAGLTAAKQSLGSGDGSKRFIVIMSDGEPTDGRTGDELVAYARSMRDPDNDGTDETIIYTLGFNESSDGQWLLRSIASDGCFFSVQESADLEDFFADMVDGINGVKFMYARIACPVDVSVTYDGETLSSFGDDPVTRTAFGTLTFEEPEAGKDRLSDDDVVKVLRLREGASYDIDISGYNDGSMDYSIGFVNDDGVYSDFRTFNDVKVNEHTKIATKAEVSSSTQLVVDEDGDGVVDKTYQAGANETARLVDNGWIVRLVVAGMALVALLTSVLVIRHKVEKNIARKQKQ